MEDKDKKLIAIIIALIVVIVGIGAYVYMTTADFSVPTDYESSYTPNPTNTNSSGNDSNSYTYIGGVPFNIPSYYNLMEKTDKDGVISVVYENSNGDTLNIAVGSSESASQFAKYMNNNGWNFRQDSSRNLYYLSHPTINGYIYDYSGKTVYVLADNLDDLHKVCIFDSAGNSGGGVSNPNSGTGRGYANSDDSDSLSYDGSYGSSNDYYPSATVEREFLKADKDGNGYVTALELANYLNVDLATADLEFVKVRKKSSSGWDIWDFEEYLKIKPKNLGNITITSK